jgi:hypothetical protein
MPEITSPLIFWGVALLLVGYVVSMMVRKRKGERPGQADREGEL